MDRAKLAQLIFDDPKAKSTLEAIVHPRIQEAFDEILERCLPGDVVIYQIPLLVETGAQDRFDFIITVSAPLELRRKRLLERGMKSYEIEKRISAQATDAEREEVADFVFMNDGDADDLLRLVENIYEDLLLPRAQENFKK